MVMGRAVKDGQIALMEYLEACNCNLFSDPSSLVLPVPQLFRGSGDTNAELD